LGSTKDGTNTVYIQLDNIQHSFERLFPSIHFNKQLQNCSIASKVFAWRAGKQSHPAVATRFSFWIYCQQETYLSALQPCFASDAAEPLSTCYSS